jgi:uroporphyrinogen-III decarboxylase
MSKADLPERLAGLNFEAHNTEVRAAWLAYRAGTPYRAPIILGTNTRFFMHHPEANPQGVTFEEYCNDPDIMFDCQLRFQHFQRFNLLQDAELGLPDVWTVRVDFQNFYDASWFGCPVVYAENEVPDTRPIFAGNPEAIICQGVDFSPPLEEFGRKFHVRFRVRASRETFLGRPIQVHGPSWLGTDGVMTVACNLFGANFVCMAMAAEPDRIARLFNFITDATIKRMTEWRKRLELPVYGDGFGSADDSIALISTRMYKDSVLPFHHRLYDTFGPRNNRSIHLCGDSTRHFVTIRDELGVKEFDTGFPVDFAKIRRDLGPSVAILGGPHVEMILNGSPNEIHAEVRRILSSGILDGPFVLREGNNLAPGTPYENTDALYQAGREFGDLRKDIMN